MRSRLILFLIFLLASTASSGAAKLYIREPEHGIALKNTGNMQHGSLGSMLDYPLSFQVTDSAGNPAANEKVYLDILYAPDNTHNFGPSRRLVYTDTNGIAQVSFKLGDVAGEYAVMAKLAATSEHNRSQYEVYRFYARPSNWVFLLLMGMAGGLALFLFGISLMSEGLKKTAGDKMRSILSQLTNNRIIGLGLGTVGTVIIPSSTAVSVMLVSFVNAGLMKFRQTVPVLLGAAIGTTVIAQLIAFKLSDYSMLFIAGGALMYLFAGTDLSRNIGQSLLGFGILFYGMNLLSLAMNPLRTYEPFIWMITHLSNPFLGLLIGTIFTVIIQSSSASIGILMVLASQGLISLELSMAFVLGANLGTPVTALIACIKTSKESQKVAVALFVYKVIMVLLFIWLIVPIAELVRYISPDAIDLSQNAPSSLPRQIANSHTLFNVLLACIILPVTDQFSYLIESLFFHISKADALKKEAEQELTATRYISGSVLSTPSLATGLAKKEIGRLWRRLFALHDFSLEAVLNSDKSKLEDLRIYRNEFKLIRDEITNYLYKLLKSSGTATTGEIYQLLHVVTELSHINDALSKTLAHNATEWIERSYSLSDESKQQLIEYHAYSQKMLSSSLAIFVNIDSERAHYIDNRYQAAKLLAHNVEHAHFSRIVSNNEADAQNSRAYLELIYIFRAVSEHCRNIAVAMEGDENDEEKIVLP